MISREKLIALYSAMVKYRRLATLAQEMLPRCRPLAPGLEAMVAAVTADLCLKDSFAATETKLISVFIPRSDWKDFFGPSNLKRAQVRNGHVSPSALAKEFSLIFEAADALKRSKGDAISLLFCETRMRAELWRQQLQRAGRNNLPIVLVRLTSAARHARVAHGALAFGVPRIAVDANDVLAVYRVASESIARARHRRGPTLIECLQIARSANPIPSAADPIHAMELVLARKRILNRALKQKIDAAIRRELNKTLRLRQN